jgi:DNA-binding NtrC family response regulator
MTTTNPGKSENVMTLSKPAYVLVVDDDVRVLGVLSMALESAGYRVKSTVSGADALNLLRNENFDAVVLDLSMPQPDGFEVLKEARSISADLKIVVISGVMRGPLLRAASLMGGAATLEKPVDPDVLVQTIAAVLEGRSTESSGG